MEQAVLAVLTGTLIFVIGKLVDSLCIQPLISYKKVIGEITYQLVFYANTYSSRLTKEKKQKEASDKLRESASRLQVYYNPIEWMCFLWFIPSRKNIDDATGSLIGLSNSIPPIGNEITHCTKYVNDIRRKLKIKYLQ